MKKLRNFLTLLLMAVASGSYAATVVDVLTADDLAATGSQYTDFSGVKKNTAVYAGQTARNNENCIQMRSKNSNSGIVSTTTGGQLKSIKLTFSASSTNQVDVYGKNSSYTDASDLYGSSDQGELLGSLTEDGTITVSGNYAYVGLRSKNGAVYISSIEITWDGEAGSGTETPPATQNDGKTEETAYSVADAMIACAALEDNGTSGDVFVKGIIWKIDEVSVQHGNATYWISDDGGSSQEFEVYRGKYLGGENFTAEDQIQVGDEVILQGKLKNYVSSSTGVRTLELNQGNKIVRLNGEQAVEKEEAGLKWSVSNFIAYIGENNVFPTLENPNQLDVTYRTANEEVATIDANGNITLVGIGQTSVFAESAATDLFKAGSASYQLVVSTQAVPVEGNYVLVGSISELKAGDLLVVANTPEEGEYYAISTTQNKNNRKATEITVTNGKASITDQVAIIKLESSKNGWNFYVTNGDNVGYLSATTANSNWMHTVAEKSDLTTATISESENGGFTVSFGGDVDRNIMRFNPNNGNPIFSCYASSSTTGTAISFYKSTDASADDPTAISNVAEQKADSAIYTLQGVRVEKAVKGVYIIGGKKVVVK